MALVRTPRTAWVQAGLEALAAGGPQAVRVEALARSLGVTKGGFYGQFEGRQELLSEMLDTWEGLVVDAAIAQVEAGGGDARAKLWRLFAIAAVAGEPALKIELAVRDWARRDKAVAGRLRRVDERRMEYMRSLFGQFCADAEQVEARCLLAFSLFIGNHFVMADHRGRTRAQALELAVRELLR